MIKLTTSYGQGEQQMYDTVEYLEVSATSKEQIRILWKWVNSHVRIIQLYLHNEQQFMWNHSIVKDLVKDLINYV